MNRMATTVMWMLSASSALAQEADRISVMTYNIWVGGTKGDPNPEISRARTLDVMRVEGAEIVCIQEHAGEAQTYASRLGCNAAELTRSTVILTRFEIVEKIGDVGARVRLPSGRDAYVFNVHFPAAPYQPYQLASIEYYGGRFITSAADAITEARLARGEPALACLRAMQPALRSGEPVFLCGDFNEPSGLDWTPEAASAGRVPVAVDWPTMRMFLDAGLRDSYRARYHEDVLTKPGHTWTPQPGPKDVHDRIDFVLFAGAGVDLLGSMVIGEESEKADVRFDSYPSDHRAVVSEFHVSPKAIR